MDFFICPEQNCDAPAEIIDEWTFGSTDGPIAHVKTICRRGHCLTPRVDQMVAREAATATRSSSAA